jgi:hypothetical protein
MGASNEPSRGSMSWPGEGIALRKLSERGLYALVGFACSRRRTERSDSAEGNEKNMLLGQVGDSCRCFLCQGAARFSSNEECLAR